MKDIRHLRLNIPAPPRGIGREIEDYLTVVTRLLQKFFDNVELVIPDKNLDGSRSVQNIGAAFTVEPDAFIIDMQVTAARVSSLTTAIKNGRDNQRVVLCNLSAFNITIANAANTILNGTVNAVLTPNGSLTLRWTGTIWQELGRSIP